MKILKLCIIYFYTGYFLDFLFLERDPFTSILKIQDLKTNLKIN